MKKATEDAEVVSERALERMEHMNPPDDRPFALLACAVILAAAKDWNKTGNAVEDDFQNRFIADFFLGPDYRFWRNFTDLRMEGADLLDAIAEHGGLVGRSFILQIDDAGDL